MKFWLTFDTVKHYGIRGISKCFASYLTNRNQNFVSKWVYVGSG